MRFDVLACCVFPPQENKEKNCFLVKQPLEMREQVGVKRYGGTDLLPPPRLFLYLSILVFVLARAFSLSLSLFACAQGMPRQAGNQNQQSLSLRLYQFKLKSFLVGP